MTKEVISYEKVCGNHSYDLPERVASYWLRLIGMNAPDRRLVAQIGVDHTSLEGGVHIRIAVIIHVLAVRKEILSSLFHIGSGQDTDFFADIILMRDMAGGFLRTAPVFLPGKGGEEGGKSEDGDQNADDELVCPF